MKVFWSWQSDRPSKFNRSFLKRVMIDAIDRAANELGLDERPEIDHDVQGLTDAAASPNWPNDCHFPRLRRQSTTYLNTHVSRL